MTARSDWLPAEIEDDLGRLKALCGRVAPEHGASATITNASLRDYFEDDESLIDQVCRWIGAATVAASVIARRTSYASLAWRIARVARRIATTSLEFGSPFLAAEQRRGLEGAIVNLLVASSDAAHSKGHRSAKALIAVRLIKFSQSWTLADPYPGSVAVAVGAGVSFLIESARFAEARALIEATPDAIRRAHHDWADLEAEMEVWTKPAWSPPTTPDKSFKRLRGAVERMAKAGLSGSSPLAQQFLDRLDKGDADKPQTLIEIAAWLEDVLGTLGQVDPVAKLRMLEPQAIHAARGGADQASIAEAAERMGEISLAHALSNRWDDAAGASGARAALLTQLGHTDRAISAQLEAIDFAEKPRPDAVGRFAAGGAERARSRFEVAVDLLCAEGRLIDALLLAEACKSRMWCQVRGIRPRSAKDTLGDAALPTDLRGFVSYLAADECLFVFFVDMTGDVGFQRIEMPRSELMELVASLRPNGWASAGIFVPTNRRVLRALDFLVEPLGSMLEDADRSPRELVVSPDGILHNVPWHLLTTENTALIQRAPVRTVLSLDHWNWLRASTMPTSGSASIFVAPAADQRDPSSWNEWSRRLHTLCEQAGMQTEAAIGQDATPDRLLRDLVASRLVHVRCHGHFPDDHDADAEAAFTSSGLLLPSPGRCLQRSVNATPTLTPAMILDLEPASDAVRRGHVSLEACVSGVVRDGAAGDPVSLPWMLAMIGVPSVIAAHWHVTSAHAEEFFDAFYRSWLLGGLTRSEAYRQATLIVLRRHGEVAAAFKLMGDGR